MHILTSFAFSFITAKASNIIPVWFRNLDSLPTPCSKTQPTSTSPLPPPPPPHTHTHTQRSYLGEMAIHNPWEGGGGGGVLAHDGLCNIHTNLDSNGQDTWFESQSATQETAIQQVPAGKTLPRWTQKVLWPIVRIPQVCQLKPWHPGASSTKLW